MPRKIETPNPGSRSPPRRLRGTLLATRNHMHLGPLAAVALLAGTLLVAYLLKPRLMKHLKR